MNPIPQHSRPVQRVTVRNTTVIRPGIVWEVPAETEASPAGAETFVSIASDVEAPAGGAYVSTGLEIELETGQDVTFKAEGLWQASVTNEGARFQFSGPSGDRFFCEGFAHYAGAVTQFYYATMTSISDVLLSPTVVAGSPWFFRFLGRFRASEAGTFALNLARETSGTASVIVQADSWAEFKTR